jgi:hypothetical protein
MNLTNRELAIVLTALRTWQASDLGTTGRGEAIAIAGHFEDHAPLAPTEVDDLCERLNILTPAPETPTAPPVARPPQLYDALIAAGCHVDSYESHLYVEGTPTAVAILKQYGHPLHPSRSAKGAPTIWYDVPFMFKPFWDRLVARW